MMVNIQQINGAYSLWLVFFGTFANMLVVYVCFRLRKHTTFVFLAFISISDIFTFYNWNVNIFTYFFFWLDITYLSLFGCRILYFVQYSSLQISAWLLILMSIDRLLMAKSVKWKRFFKSKQAAFVCTGFSVALLLINSNVLFKFGAVISVNGTDIILCGAGDGPINAWMGVWSTVHSSLYSFCPCTVLVLTNLLLIIGFNRRKIQAASITTSQKAQLTLNRTVIFVTLLFIIMTLPGAIAQFMVSELISRDLMLLFTLLLSFSSSYNAYGLIILSFTNKRFSKELRSLFTNNKVNQGSQSMTVSHSTLKSNTA